MPDNPQVLTRPLSLDAKYRSLFTDLDDPNAADKPLTRPLTAVAPATQPVMARPITKPTDTGGVMSDLGTALKRRVTQPVADAVDYTKQNFKEGVKNITDPETVMSPDLSGQFNARLSPPRTAADVAKPEKPDVPNPVSTQLKRPLGVVQAATAPLFAASHGFISKPIEEATGGKIKADWVDLTRMFTPIGAAAVAGAAGRINKIPAVGKVTSAIGKSEPVVKAAQAIKSILAPTSMSKEAGAAEGIVREARGLAERDTARAQEQINGISREVNALPAPEQRNFVNYIETRSQGTKLQNPAMQKAADVIRDVYQKVRTKLENSPHTEKMGFIQDYFVHQWKDPKKAQAFINDWVAKAGSGKSLNKRSIPTIEEGIKAGLVPVHDNPLDATMSYVGNMNNYLALKEVQGDMSAQKLRKFYPEGRQEPGWVELKGPGNRVVYAAEDKAKGGHYAGVNVAYAPEDAARIYNRYYGAGFQGKTGDLYKMLRSAVNGPTQLLLGFSGYHYRLISGEQTASALAEGFGRLAKGDIAGAGRSAVKAIPYVGAVRSYLRGERVGAQAMGKQAGMDNKVVDYIARAGGRTQNYDTTMKASQSNNFWEAWKKGTLKAEMASGIDDIKAAGATPAGVAKAAGFFFRNVGKLMDTVAYPLFAKTIPNIKNSVNYDGIADWMKMNPGASDSEIMKAARGIVDSTDNRFGEMIQDNIFWDKKLKQSLQLALLSVGWDIGTQREVLGGTKDLGRYLAGNGELTPRAKYIIGAPLAHMLHASAYQYIKTGQGPQVPQDLVYPRTGGTVTQAPGTKYGKKVPERLRQPSQMNDVIAYQEDPLHELQNKMAPVWKIVGDMATNSDWRGDPISYEYMKNAPSGLIAYAKYIASALTPISASQIAKRAPGTNIGAVEKLSGSNPAGMRARDPEGYRAYMKKLEEDREKKGMKHRANE